MRRVFLAVLEALTQTSKEMAFPALPRSFLVLLRVLRLRWIIGGAFFVLLAFIIWVSRDLPTAETFSARAIAQSTRIYDRTGTILLYDLHGDEKRTLVNLQDVSPDLIHATLVAEDDQFYHHAGVDLPGIVRSVLTNAKEFRLAQGGSTITQQLVRNAVLTTEKTFARKIREAILAFEIEARFSKDEILEAYLNQIPYGSLIYGAEAAAQTYFGRSAKDLSSAEAAALAALPKAPSYYSPYGTHRDELLTRKDHILTRMAELGYISAQEALISQQEELVFLPPKENIRAPHFVFYVQEELERRFGKERVEQGGLRVITTLNADTQAAAENAIVQGAARNESRFKGRNAALVALDPRNGEILAMVGSKDYFDPAYDGNVNVATRQRQPGSSFKPVVYAAAFKRGFTPDTVIFDVPTEFSTGGKSYSPQNYTGQTYGPITARQALANSLNIASVKVLWLAGVHETVAFAKTLGINTLTNPDEYGLSLVLGGGAVTLLEETAAFGVFAADGMRAETEAVLKVETSNNETLFEYHANPYRVVDEEVARNINNILSDNSARSLVFGPNTPLTLGSRPVAAKTGTAQDFRDAWTVGYTPSLAAGVWVGNNDYSPMRKGADGSVVAAPIWNTFMREVLVSSPIENFKLPKPILTDKPILNGSWAVENKVRIDRASGKRATEQTPPEWVEERVYRTVHDTLYWIDKRNPRGPVPDNPASDAQFAHWEKAVQEWLAAKPDLLASIQNSPPEGYDDIHIPENQPTLRIIHPQAHAALSANLLVSVFATAPLHIDSVVVFLDDSLLGTMPKNPVDDTMFEKTFVVPSRFFSVERPGDKKERLLSVRVFDQYGNRQEQTVSLVLFSSDE